MAHSALGIRGGIRAASTMNGKISQEQLFHFRQQQSTGENSSGSHSSIMELGRQILHTFTQRQTYLKQLYLIISVPLGFCFSGILLLGILGGIGLLLLGIGIPLIYFSVIKWGAMAILECAGMFFIGIPLLYLMIVAWWGMAVFEVSLVRHWLQIDIPPLPSSLLKIASGRPRLRLHLSQGITWKTLIYLLAKGPFSVCVGLLWPTGLFCSGLIGLLILGGSLFAFPLLVLGVAIALISKQEERTFTFYRRLFRGSIALILLPLSLLNEMADLWGHFARLMLTIGEHERELLEAREIIKRERARADHAEQQRRDLIANLSHDLRTPVANIRGHAEALLKLANEAKSPTSLPEQQHAYLTIIHREAIRLGTLFDELLALARSETHELHLSMEAINLQEVIEEVYQTLKPLAYSERRITVGRTIAPDLPAVKADRQRVQQVLLNLVRNAITYTPHGGLVAMTLQRADTEHLVLAVADTGMGIAPADQARIFERFYRPEDAPTGGGTGLGLAIVRELIEAMGGSVTVESSVGEGSCFSIMLPIA